MYSLRKQVRIIAPVVLFIMKKLLLLWFRKISKFSNLEKFKENKEILKEEITSFFENEKFFDQAGELELNFGKNHN